MILGRTIPKKYIYIYICVYTPTYTHGKFMPSVAAKPVAVRPVAAEPVAAEPWLLSLWLMSLWLLSLWLLSLWLLSHTELYSHI